MKSQTAGSSAFRLRATPFGPVAAVWSLHRGAPKIDRILLSRPGLTAAKAVRILIPRSGEASCRDVDILLDRIEAFLNGEPIGFSLDQVRMDGCSAFQRKVLRAEHAIPRGRVSTYRLIAAKLGDPNSARAVGTALARNPFPIVIPCHRAVRSGGGLGGYQGGTAMKRALLEMEGVPFRGGDRVADRNFYYEGRKAGPRPGKSPR